jgi:Flp pilus assembly protein CpaB
MRRGRTLIMVLLIIIIGVIVAFFAFSQFFGGGNTAEQTPTTVEVFVAGQNIPQGEEVTEAALQRITIPQDKVVDVMFQADELGSLLGKVAKYPLDQGVVITSSMVGDGSASIPISGPQWASLIPAGQTAISIPADRLSLAGYAVADGAHVNINACFLFVDVDPSFQSALPNRFVVLTGTGFTEEGVPLITLGAGIIGGEGGAGEPPMQGRLELEPAIQQPYYLIPSESQRPRMVCQILLQDVVVLKVGNFSLTPVASTEGDPAAVPADPAAQQGPTGPDIVTLLVSPQDSITLSYLIQTDAELNLTLRNPSDQARQATEASTLQFLLSQYNIPVPAKLPYSLEPYTTALGNLILPNDIVPVPAE